MQSESLIIILAVGLIAGWLAGQIVQGTGYGLINDLVIGVIGAFIGGWLLPELGIHLGLGIISAIINATVGAVLLLLVLRLVRGGGRWGSRWGWRRVVRGDLRFAGGKIAPTSPGRASLRTSTKPRRGNTAPTVALMIAEIMPKPRWMPSSGSNHPPMKAPMTPMTRSLMSPYPVPWTIWPASHPAMSPTARMMIRLSLCMTRSESSPRREPPSLLPTPS